MKTFPAALERLSEQFARLPGIGSKTAQRLAFQVLSMPQEQARNLPTRFLTRSGPSIPVRCARI